MSDRTHTEYTLDASVSRMTAVLVAVIAFVAVIAHSVWLVAFLALDFLLRGAGLGLYSLLERCGDELAHYFASEPKMIDPAPERFTARVGFVLAFASTVLYALEMFAAGSALTSVIVLVAAIEAGLATSVGTRVLSVLPPRLAALLAR